AAATGGMPGRLLHWSGVEGARSVMAVVEPRDNGLCTTALLDIGDGSLDGWLDLTQTAPARQLAADLPAGGLGGLVLAVDPAGLLAGAGERMSSFRRALADGCHEIGLDLERHFVRRLGKRGSLQLLFLQGEHSQLVSAYAFQCKSRAAAKDMFEDALRAARDLRLGKYVPITRSGDQLELWLAGADEPAHVGVVEDLLVVGFHPDAVTLVADELKKAARQKKRDLQAVQALQSLGGADKVAGVFAFDFAPLLEALGREQPAHADGATDLGGIPCRHAGSLELLGRADGRAIVRVQLLSTN
ncbi:MAG TPA: hypothetical protein VK348_06015, partial [Planctomycetota bacterium]|nr:hypothetical protein [Planctomycetota bacterium]